MTDGCLLAGALVLWGDLAEDLPRLSKPHQTKTPISTHHINLAIGIALCFYSFSPIALAGAR